MAGSRTTRQIGEVTRIYKNSDNCVLAIDDITITADVMRISETKFHISVHSVTPCRTLTYLGTGNRVISKIQVVGVFSSVSEDAGNYLVYTWLAKSENENDVVISLSPYVSVLGDTI